MIVNCEVMLIFHFDGGSREVIYRNNRTPVSGSDDRLSGFQSNNAFII